MHVVQTYANLDEKAPNPVFTKVLVLSFVIKSLPEKLVQVSVFTKLHDDVDPLVLCNKGIIVFNYVRRIHARHYINLSQSLIIFPQSPCVNLFYDHYPSFTMFFSNFKNLSITTLTDDLQALIVVPLWRFCVHLIMCVIIHGVQIGCLLI